MKFFNFDLNFNEQEEVSMKKIIFLTLFAALAVFLVGCEKTAPNTNNARVNNSTLNNANNAIVVNNNTNVATNTNRKNANVNREEYDKNKAEYEKDKGSSSIGQGANDSWLWFKTRAALLAADDLRESTINVDVANDVVTLKGTVASKAESDKAASVAKGIEGVKSVTNQLKVAPKDSMTNMSTNEGKMDDKMGNKNANMKK